jgi:DNA polymerase sigma
MMIIIRLVKVFVRRASISDATSDSLSSYAWIVLSLHFLLRNKYLPNIQPPESVRTHQESLIDLRFSVLVDLPEDYRERLASVDVLKLFREFLCYYLLEFNIEMNSATLRGTNTCGALTIPKSSWTKCYAWRFSIEDVSLISNMHRAYFYRNSFIRLFIVILDF